MSDSVIIGGVIGFLLIWAVTATQQAALFGGRLKTLTDENNVLEGVLRYERSMHEQTRGFLEKAHRDAADRQDNVISILLPEPTPVDKSAQ